MDNSFNELRKKIADQKKSRSSAVERLKKCAEAANTSCKPPKNKKLAEGQKPSEELMKLERIRGRAKKARSDRQDSLARLKRTTFQAVKTIRETVALSSDELRKRMTDERDAAAG